MIPSSDYDVIIIGAGILGGSAAYHMKKNNPAKRMLLLDRYAGAAQGNTGRSNSMFRNTFTSSDNQILSDASIDYYLELQESGVDIGIKKTGYLWLLSEDQLSANERHIARMLDAGIQVRRCDKLELKKALPSLQADLGSEEASLMNLKTVETGVFGAKCGQLDAVRLTSYYIERFRKMGGEVAFSTNAENLLAEPMESLGIEGEPFLWQDSKINGLIVSGSISAKIRAETIVVATGAWNNELLAPLGIDGRVKAKKRQIFKIQAGGDTELSKLLRNDSFNDINTLPFVILPSGCLIKAIPESSEFWVACDDDFTRAYIDVPSRDLDDYKAEPEYYQNNVNRILKEYFREFKDKKSSKMWAGLYSYNTLDYLPFVFSEKGVIVIGGDSGSGIMKGDSLGRIADAVYRGEKEAELYGGKRYSCSKLGFSQRDVEREQWVI